MRSTSTRTSRGSLARVHHCCVTPGDLRSTGTRTGRPGMTLRAPARRQAGQDQRRLAEAQVRHDAWPGARDTRVLRSPPLRRARRLGRVIPTPRTTIAPRAKRGSRARSRALCRRSRRNNRSIMMTVTWGGSLGPSDYTFPNRRVNSPAAQKLTLMPSAPNLAGKRTSWDEVDSSMVRPARLRSRL
jgi:hypothetical protein